MPASRMITKRVPEADLEHFSFGGCEMRPTCAKCLVTGFALIGALLASEAAAETLKFKATLAGSSEVPPNEGVGKAAGDVILDTDSKKLTWTVTSSGSSDDATAAHFHGPAASGGRRYFERHGDWIGGDPGRADRGSASRKVVSEHPR